MGAGLSPPPPPQAASKAALDKVTADSAKPDPAASIEGLIVSGTEGAGASAGIGRSRVSLCMGAARQVNGLRHHGATPDDLHPNQARHA
jgi:hypothetical protein